MIDAKDTLICLRQAAKSAGTVLLDMQSRTEVVKKDRNNPVTNTDHTSDLLIQELLGKHCPGIPFLTEESGGERIVAGPLFVIDALDGTSNFYHRDDAGFWAVSVAYVLDGMSKLGVIYQPHTSTFFEADDNGARRRTTAFGAATRLHVSVKNKLSESCVWSDWTKDDDEMPLNILRKLKRSTVLPQVRVCCTMSAMQVAMGKIEGYVHPGPRPEDIAAAALIVERAGGRVTDIMGQPWTPFTELPVVMSNGSIHSQLLEVLNA